jgi:hypothetical protein
MAIEANTSVQEVPYEALKSRLLKDGQVLSYKREKRLSGLDPARIPGIVVDDESATSVGIWTASNANPPFVGNGYRHDGNEGKGDKKYTFTAMLPAEGMYSVAVFYSTNANRATNVPVVVTHAGGEARVVMNQRKSAVKDGYTVLGTYRFARGAAKVEISNKGTDGYVIADAVRWLPVR